eukprot:jgi/Ulvmu1/4400/UM002_0125.1
MTSNVIALSSTVTFKPDLEHVLIVFIAAGNRCIRLAVSHRCRAKLAMQVEQGYLGNNAAALSEPLHAFNLYRRHPEHNVLYQNWTMGQLQDGDVLVIRHHSQFFAAVTSESPRVCTSSATTRLQRLKAQKARSQGGRHHVSAWRGFLRHLVRDPFHSWWSLTWVTAFSSCIVVSTGLLMLASLSHIQSGTSNQQIQTVNRTLTYIFTAELGVRSLSYVTIKECIMDVYMWVDLVAIVPDYMEMALHQQIPKLEVLKILRLLRMFKIFKLFRRSFCLIAHTLYDSLSTLSTIVFLIMIGTFMMASVIFSVEAVHLDPLTQLYLAPASYLCQRVSETNAMHALTSVDADCELVDHPPMHVLQCPRLFQASAETCRDVYAISPFQSLMHGGWFTVMTLTSVGYGDIVPSTSSGALVGYLTMLTGLISISLPISVIASSLSIQYKEIFGAKTYQ